jgi:hypothetical protein
MNRNQLHSAAFFAAAVIACLRYLRDERRRDPMKPGQNKHRAVGFAVLHSTRDKKAESAFERFVAENNIPEPMWMQSLELREWCKRHANNRYVPEVLLTAFQIRVSDRLEYVYREAQ